MNWSSPDLAGTFKLFQQKCDLYFTVRDINPERRASHILLYVGDEGLRIFNSWSLSAADNLIWEKFTAHIEPQVNFRVQRYYLQKYIQSEEESIGLYRDVWIAAIASSRKSLATQTAAICVRFHGRRVRHVYVTMQITFLARKSALIYRRGLRQRVASLTIDCNGVFAIRAY